MPTYSKSNGSHSVNSKSTSSIDINTGNIYIDIGNIYEIIEYEDIHEDATIDDNLVINSSPRERRINSFEVTESSSIQSSKRRKGTESSTPNMNNIKRLVLPRDVKNQSVDNTFPIKKNAPHSKKSTCRR